MTHSFDRMLVKQYDGKSVDEILSAPPSALSGVSAADADHLNDAFGIETVRDLAECRFFHEALAVAAAAGTPRFDPGPPSAWDDFFAGAPVDHYVNHTAKRFRHDFGPVYYRGRLDGSARVVVVGQDPSTNEILAHRVFVGFSGQQVQGFLKKLGVTRSYAMLNMSLFSIYGQADSEMKNIMLEPPILSFRNAFLDRLAAENPIEAVIAVGKGGEHAVDNWPGAQQCQVFAVTHPSAPEASVIASWNGKLPLLQAAVSPDDDGQPDPNPYGAAFGPEDAAPIPRFDLPFGIPSWHGAGSGHSTRDDELPNQGFDPGGVKRIVWIAP